MGLLKMSNRYEVTNRKPPGRCVKLMSSAFKGIFLCFLFFVFSVKNENAKILSPHVRHPKTLYEKTLENYAVKGIEVAPRVTQTVLFKCPI